MDLYQELGVSKTASAEEIKRAYKKLAMKYHPDRGGDTEKLSKINAAYTVLKDPQKRAEYDNPMPHGFGGFHTSGPDMSSMFEQMFRQRGGFRPASNQNITMTAVLTLAECYNGKKFSATYVLPNGKQESVTLDIPVGMRHGDTVRVPGKGDHSNTQYPPGDLHIRISVKSTHGWDIHDYDLVTRVDVNVLDLMTGSHVIIKTPNDKTIKLKIPPGTNPNAILSVPGYGLPRPDKSAGVIHVGINAIVSEVTDSALSEKIKEIKNGIVEVSK